jgi:hypothetical protein
MISSLERSANMRRSWIVVAAVGMVGTAVATAAADEAKSSVNASMMLNILSTPVAPRELAYDESVRDKRPAPPQAGFVLQPDGSLRYVGQDGRTTATVTVQNPCPPGSGHYEPPPLPGRRAKN